MKEVYRNSKAIPIYRDSSDTIVSSDILMDQPGQAILTEGFHE
jgi:hypothetical protein